MSSVSEIELKQKVSELILFVREYMLNTDRDVKIKDSRDGFVLTIIDKDVTLDFSL